MSKNRPFPLAIVSTVIVLTDSTTHIENMSYEYK